MTILNDTAIHARGAELVTPYDPEMAQPASLEVRLDNKFLRFSDQPKHSIDPSEDNTERFTEYPSQYEYLMRPGEFLLGSTYEQVHVPEDMAARFEGKSSLGRLGLFTHVTAGFIDPGFSGHITVELYNCLPVPLVIYPGMKIGQICFMQMNAAAAAPYGSGTNQNRYQNQRGPTASLGFRNFHITDVSGNTTSNER